MLARLHALVDFRSDRRRGAAVSVAEAFRHEALFYSGDDEFVERVGSFVREGVEGGEPVLVVVSGRKIGLLRSSLGPIAAGAAFADMNDVGHNPARIIPAWRDFVSAHSGPGVAVRGVGEPISPERSPDELVECQLHEALLDVAFADDDGFTLLCPYDVEGLGPDVVQQARYTHPRVGDGGAGHESVEYEGAAGVSRRFQAPLPEPAFRPAEVPFGRGPLVELRRYVSSQAAALGLGPERAADLVLAVDELASNSVRHGAGSGAFRIWGEEHAVVCEVRDSGRFDRPLAGREQPSPQREGGSGLWLANQLCDLVQIRALDTGTVVRLRVSSVDSPIGE